MKILSQNSMNGNENKIYERIIWVTKIWETMNYKKLNNFIVSWQNQKYKERLESVKTWQDINLEIQ